MNISAFSESHFDPKEWINETFRSPEALENKEAYLTSVVSKLQLYVQQVNGAMEETSEHVLKSMPRVIHDANMIHKEALLLKEKMQLVKEEITKIQKDTAASMAALEKLDKMKTELQVAKQALHEADNWTMLASDIEDVIESRNIDAIASKVISMQQSLVVLANCADFDDRKLKLESYKNTLEAIASPQVVKAFTSKSIEESKKFVEIFSGMEKLPQLIRYYAKCEKDSLCQEWTKLVDFDQDRTVLEWLSSFYHTMLTNWQTQGKWCQKVFNSVNMLPAIYIDVLITLEKDMVSAIDLAVKQHQDQLQFLIQLREVTDQFSQSFSNAISQFDVNAEEAWPQIEKALYTIYKGYFSNYASYEEHQLGKEVSDLVINGDLIEAVQGVGQSTTLFANSCNKAIARCKDLTNFASFPGLVSAIQFSVLKHLEHYVTLLSQIEVERQNKEEWAMFQICLLYLQNIGDFQNCVEELDKDLVHKFLHFEKSAKESKFKSKEILLDKQALEQYITLYTSLKESDEPSVLTKARKKLMKVSNRGYHTTLDVMLTPILDQLELAPAAWASNSSVTQQLPDYSYAPLEYITQIGEYLMTLPQHLEPFLNKEGGESRADLLLGNIAKQTCTIYIEHLLSTKDVTPNMAKQIAIDIGYLGNVLEDLGFSLSEHLSQIALLLKIPVESYQKESAGCSAKLVSIVRQMRNITST
ncbi:conserved oligomeric Golgi complex subunit 7 [Cimex lectularius]|uniref:Conserved oligomeric Golgi complex subunit 7 n=1 Tax=Cimex lectularius TaxID=79782 RepID=A0A8I6RPF6_CIMLE|nr:conserved oligomeric Golgi complex subunit 7 [Cimex lectularius]